MQLVVSNLKIQLAGDLVPFYFVFSYLMAFCIYKTVNTWFDGVIFAIINLVVTLYISLVILLPINKCEFLLILSGFSFRLDIFFTFLFWVIIITEILKILLEIYRFKVDANLEEEFARAEQEDNIVELAEESLQGDQELTNYLLLEYKVQDWIEQEKTRIVKERSWLDPVFQSVHLDDPEDKFIIPEWNAQSTQYNTSLHRKLKNLLHVYFYISIYAFLAFIFQDHMQMPYDNTVAALLLPLITYVLLSFRSIWKLFFANLLFLIIIYFILFPLVDAHIITVNAILFVWIFYTITYYASIVFLLFLNPLQFVQAIFTQFTPPFDIANIAAAKEMTLLLARSIFALEAILTIMYLIVKGIYSRRKKSVMKLSKNYLFLRDKTRLSKLQDYSILLSILFYPLNIQEYRRALARLQYNRVIAQEGREFDYTRIPLLSGAIIRKKSAVPLLQWIAALIFIVFGTANTFSGFILLSDIESLMIFLHVPAEFSFATFPVVVTAEILNLIILMLGAFLLLSAINKRKLYRIIITFDRSKVEGGWKLTHTYTQVTFRDTTKDFARFFDEYTSSPQRSSPIQKLKKILPKKAINPP